ncbi:MAG TPA: YdcF family protein [Candidatus Blautia excrementipullorum]|nr:YdcF family protein [Candidatus Blautia excrementipullorum]
MRVPENLDYLIVLGAHVDGTRLTLALLERTRRALQYLKENPRTIAVLSGGRGSGEQISEAQAMFHYLTAHGIPKERLILEDRSVNTKENLAFSLEKIGRMDVSVGVVTNHFHVFRGVAIGKKCGCRAVYPVPARYRSWRLLIYVPREILAIIKDKIMGNL